MRQVKGEIQCLQIVHRAGNHPQVTWFLGRLVLLIARVLEGAAVVEVVSTRLDRVLVVSHR